LTELWKNKKGGRFGDTVYITDLRHATSVGFCYNYTYTYIQQFCELCFSLTKFTKLERQNCGWAVV